MFVKFDVVISRNKITSHQPLISNHINIQHCLIGNGHKRALGIVTVWSDLNVLLR